MSLLIACYESPYALARSQLDLVVQIYVTTYLAFVFAGAVCLSIRGAFDSWKTGDAGPPPKGEREAPGSDASTFDH
jgi:hypothetical protein